MAVTHLKTANTGAANQAFSIEVYTRVGAGLNGLWNGPGSSTSGWTLLGTASAVQGSTAGGISELVDIPDIAIGAGGTVGVGLKFLSVGPRYFGFAPPPYSVYSDANLSMTTGDSRSQPFTIFGNFYSSRDFVGELHYDVVPEPATMAALGLGALAVLRKSRRN